MDINEFRMYFREVVRSNSKISVSGVNSKRKG